MGLLSDFFVASKSEMDSLDIQQSPAKNLPSVQARRVEVVKVVQLQCIIDGSLFNDHLDDLDNMIVKEASDDGPWVLAVPKIITETLASADSRKIEDIGRSWALTKEWQTDGGNPEDVIPLVKQIGELAKRAQLEVKALYLWVCL